MASPALDPRFRAALMAKRRGEIQEARRILEEMLGEDPEHADALEVLGMMVSEDGELDLAIELTSRLVSLQPESIMAHANLSRFYMLKGDKETAEEWQAKARVLGWKEEVGRKASAAAGSGMETVSPDMVEKQEKAVEERPDDAMARMALASSYRKLGMPVKAVSHLQHALTIDDTLSNVYLALGQSLEEANMKEDAAEVYRRGVPIADKKGDFMPRNQMASKLTQIEKDNRS